MSHELDLDDHPSAAPTMAYGRATPGKRSMTQGLAPRPMLYRRATRDDRGVAPDAEAAVDRAAGTSGAPLPTHVQRQFEGSLGADLSSVRIHTGAASADAAHAVGAKAYTVGDDIHFAAGHYQPDDPFGLHLLAHEVAHTVQQRGAAPTRQHKLEVSAPHDAAEHDADRAADAMVRGAPTTVASSQGASSVVAREIDPDEYRSAAAEGERRAAGSDFRESPASLGVITASNVGDTQAAEAELARIREADAGFMKALDNFVVAPEVKSAYADNQTALGVISDFAAEAGVQTTSLTNFKVQYQRLILDFERLSWMAATSGVSGDQGGKAFATALIEKVGPTVSDNNAVKKDTEAPDSTASGVLSQKRADVSQWMEKMTDASDKLPAHELEITAAQNAYLAACNEVAAGIVPRQEPAAVADLKALKATIEEIKGYAKAVASLASKTVGGSLGGVVTDVVNWEQGTPSATFDARLSGSMGTSSLQFPAKGAPYERSHGDVDITLKNVPKTKGQTIGAAVGDGVGGKIPNVAEKLVEWGFQAKLNVAQAKADAALVAANAAAKRSQLHALTEKMLRLQKAAVDFMNVGGQLERAKNEYRRAVAAYARVADRSGGRTGKKLEGLAGFIGEADAYIAQSKATLAIGANEAQQAERTQAKRAKITLSTGSDECRWWDVEEAPRVASTGTKWQLNKHEVRLPVGAKGRSAAGQGAGDVGGANSQIAEEMQRLQRNEEWIKEMRRVIAAQLNL